MISSRASRTSCPASRCVRRLWLGGRGERVGFAFLAPFDPLCPPFLTHQGLDGRDTSGSPRKNVNEKLLTGGAVAGVTARHRVALHPLSAFLGLLLSLPRKLIFPWLASPASRHVRRC